MARRICCDVNYAAVALLDQIGSGAQSSLTAVRRFCVEVAQAVLIRREQPSGGGVRLARHC